eukprot:jgi/Hompol1/6280/HPOL_002618-RA
MPQSILLRAALALLAASACVYAADTAAASSATSSGVQRPNVVPPFVHSDLPADFVAVTSATPQLLVRRDNSTTDGDGDPDNSTGIKAYGYAWWSFWPSWLVAYLLLFGFISANNIATFQANGFRLGGTQH